MCLSYICLLAMHTLICVTFSRPPGVGGWLRLLLVALPGLFYLYFLCEKYILFTFLPIVLLVKRNILILYSYFHRTFMFILLASVRPANYQNLESQILGLGTIHDSVDY